MISFLIVGAQKAGTTALSAYLGEHEKIYIPPSKEVHFFDDESQEVEEADDEVVNGKQITIVQSNDSAMVLDNQPVEISLDDHQIQ